MCRGHFFAWSKEIGDVWTKAIGSVPEANNPLTTRGVSEPAKNRYCYQHLVLIAVTSNRKRLDSTRSWRSNCVQSVWSSSPRLERGKPNPRKRHAKEKRKFCWEQTQGNICTPIFSLVTGCRHSRSIGSRGVRWNFLRAFRFGVILKNPKTYHHSTLQDLLRLRYVTDL